MSAHVPLFHCIALTALQSCPVKPIVKSRHFAYTAGLLEQVAVITKGEILHASTTA